MELNTAKLGTLLSVELIAEWLRGLHRIGVIPREFSTGGGGAGGGGGIAATVTLLTLDVEMVTTGADPTMQLRLGGTVEPDGSTLALPLDTAVHIAPELRPGINPLNDAAVLGFSYGGVASPPAAPLNGTMVDDLFTSGPAALILANLTLPLLGDLIDAAGTVFFPDVANPPPAAGLWEAAVTLMPGANSAGADTVDALGLFVDVPGGDASLDEATSILPRLTEFGLVYSRAFLDTRFETDSPVGEQINGAEITEFVLEMGDTDLRVSGTAIKDSATITFSGPIEADLLRGSTVFRVDTSGVSVDVDVPWWADVLFFLTGTGGFLTFGLTRYLGAVIVKAATDQELSDILADIDAAPGQVRGSISNDLGIGMSALAQALSNLGSVDVLQAASTPEASRITDGNIAVFAQVFVNPISVDLGAGTFSRRANQLVELQLTNDRWFTTSELARIVHLGLITVPGSRAVSPHVRGGRPVHGYMQDSPDTAEADNLLSRFGD